MFSVMFSSGRCYKRIPELVPGA